jgi:hypothetical protein
MLIEEFMHGMKSVSGVRGIMVLDRQSGKIHRMLPAIYDREDIESLAASVGKFSSSGFGEGLLAAHFASGTVYCFISERFSIMMLATADSEEKILKDRMRQLLPLILKAGDGITPDETAVIRIGPEAHTQDPARLELMINALNRLAVKMRESLGGYMASRELKRSRDRLISRYQFLTGLYVDNSGNCAVITKPLTTNDQEMVRAFAELMHGTYVSCVKINPRLAAVTLKEILGDLNAELHRNGFWR